MCQLIKPHPIVAAFVVATISHDGARNAGQPGGKGGTHAGASTPPRSVAGGLDDDCRDAARAIGRFLRSATRPKTAGCTHRIHRLCTAPSSFSAISTRERRREGRAVLDPRGERDTGFSRMMRLLNRLSAVQFVSDFCDRVTDDDDP